MRRLKRNVCHTFVLCLAASAGACSNGSSSSNNGNPAVYVDFPPPQSLVEGSSITVRGRAGGPQPLLSLHVNNTKASTSNNHANWSASVPLVPGANTLVATIKDHENHTGTTQITVFSDLILAGANSIAFDTTRNR